MPYIDPKNRDVFDTHIKGLLKRVPTPNEMTYIIYKLVKERYGMDYYNWIAKSEAIRVLECAKLEYYHRVLTPHEDRAIAQNGDI